VLEQLSARVNNRGRGKKVKLFGKITSGGNRQAVEKSREKKKEGGKKEKAWEECG